MKAATQSASTSAVDSNIVVVPFSISTARGELRLALNVHKILQVVDLANFDALPENLRPYVGVINYNNTAIPLLDLVQVFGGSGSDLQNNKRVIISYFQNIVLGIIVDRTRRMMQFASSAIQPPMVALSKDEENNFLSAVINEGEHFIHLLDIESIFLKYGGDLKTGEKSVVSAPMFADRKVLVVEDAPFFRKRCVQIFSQLGVKVDTAANGAEGLELLKKNNFAYDLVFTDIEMPVMNGIEMIAELRRMKPDIKLPVLFNSAISNPVLIEDIRTRGLGDYIVKFDEKVIQQKLAELMR